MTEPLVSMERAAHTTVISLNRPHRHNALVPEMLDALLEALLDHGANGNSPLVLAAQGASFSTGGDLLGFWQNRERISVYASEIVGTLNRVLLALLTHPMPVVCAVQGTVTGGAMGLLLASDRVIMTRHGTITPWYARVGFSPDGGWLALLPGITGTRRARQWLNSDATLDAETCLRLGVVDEVVSGDPRSAALDWCGRWMERQAAEINTMSRPSGAKLRAIRQALEAERSGFVRQVAQPAALDGIARYLGIEDRSRI